MKRIIAILSILPGAALAHGGPLGENAFIAGGAHPISGLDHIIAMLAVGLWAALLAGRATWVLPLAFAAAMVTGGLAGSLGMPMPVVEPGILASVFLLGMLVLFAIKVSTPKAAALVAIFGVFHGYAHGLEGPSGILLPYVMGFAISSILLQALGLLAGRHLHGIALRLLGAAAVMGGFLVSMGG